MGRLGKSKSSLGEPFAFDLPASYLVGKISASPAHAYAVLQGSTKCR